MKSLGLLVALLGIARCAVEIDPAAMDGEQIVQVVASHSRVYVLYEKGHLQRAVAQLEAAAVSSEAFDMKKVFLAPKAGTGDSAQAAASPTRDLGKSDHHLEKHDFFAAAYRAGGGHGRAFLYDYVFDSPYVSVARYYSFGLENLVIRREMENEFSVLRVQTGNFLGDDSNDDCKAPVEIGILGRVGTITVRDAGICLKLTEGSVASMADQLMALGGVPIPPIHPGRQRPEKTEHGFLIREIEDLEEIYNLYALPNLEHFFSSNPKLSIYATPDSLLVSLAEGWMRRHFEEISEKAHELWQRHTMDERKSEAKAAKSSLWELARVGARSFAPEGVQRYAVSSLEELFALLSAPSIQDSEECIVS